jgi:elongation factor Ts
MRKDESVVTTSLVKELREQTGAGIMDCKRALEEANGDLKKASDLLKQSGLAKAEKKLGRAANQGLIETYVHAGGRIASMIELNCETDFVARTSDFKTIAREIAMQVAAMNPKYVSEDAVPAEAWAGFEAEYGDRKKAAEAVCLLQQPFIRDPKLTIGELIRQGVAKLGENVQVQRFARFEVGADRPTAASDAE